MTKRVLLITQNFYPEIGSAGNRMKNVYVLLKAHGLNVDILTTDPTYPARGIYEDPAFWNHQELNKPESGIKRVSIRKKKYSRSSWNRLIYYMEFMSKMIIHLLFSKKKYDIVLATSPPIFIGMVGLVAKLRFQAAFLLEIRDLWPESLKGVDVFNYRPIIYLFEKIEKLLYRSADSIIINSEGFTSYITAVSSDFTQKLVHIPNGARLEELKPVRQPDSGPFKVIYAGNIGLAQNDELLLGLAKALDKRNVEMTIMGYGLKRQHLMKEITRAGLMNVTVVRPRTRQETLEMIAAHHAAIVTLVDSAVFKTVLPGKVIDYMTCGVPIVAAVSGFSAETIRRAKTGLVADTQNPEEMARHIDYLKKHPNQRKALGLNGRKYVEKNFIWETNIRKLLYIIEKTVD